MATNLTGGFTAIRVIVVAREDDDDTPGKEIIMTGDTSLGGSVFGQHFHLQNIMAKKKEEMKASY